jgi:sugar lactone lactonase YvrE
MARSSRLRRALGAMLALTMLMSVAAVPVAARGSTGSLPAHIDLPNGFQPEGIESWGRWLFAGSLVDGSIWRGSATSGTGRILVQGEAGLQAAGLHIDRRGRLWVAGAGSGSVRVYSALTGRHLATYEFPTAGFINDLDIVGNTVYATDSANPQLLVIPLRRFGRLPAASAATTRTLGGDYEHVVGAFNANGIAATAGRLIIVQSATGLLFRVNPRTGIAREIDTDGVPMTNGDGLEISGRTLYVVQNRLNQVAVLRLSRSRLSADVRGTITSPDLSVPTTATLTRHGLYVVNARFGTPATPDTPYWITRLPKRP